MRDHGSLLDDDFEEQANRTMRRTAAANIAVIVTSALAAIGCGWWTYTYFLPEIGPWAIAVGIVLGIIAGYLTAAIVGSILAAVVMGGMFS